MHEARCKGQALSQESATQQTRSQDISKEEGECVCNRKEEKSNKHSCRSKMVGGRHWKTGGDWTREDRMEKSQPAGQQEGQGQTMRRKISCNSIFSTIHFGLGHVPTVLRPTRLSPRREWCTRRALYCCRHSRASL